MEAARSSGGGSGESDVYAPEFAETLRFEEEIQSLMQTSFDPHGGAGSFTALLGLGPSQAVELCGGFLPFGCSPTFPSNPALLDRAARFSVFAAAEDSPQSKAEPADSGTPPAAAAPPQRSGKRKDGEKSKAKAPAKKSRGAEDPTAGEQLPYVHVRARRGQATDSHSLAERARREKINSRMKLLQELVPGCSKISGTALVLEEIINHVQSLQRQVELLSMRLAAVNPRVDMGGIDAFLSSSAAGEVEHMAVVEGGRWHVDHHHHHLLRHHDQQQQEATNDPSSSSLSLLGYDGSPVSVSLQLNQLKMEL